jgi:hypothetical protein
MIFRSIPPQEAVTLLGRALYADRRVDTRMRRFAQRLRRRSRRFGQRARDVARDAIERLIAQFSRPFQTLRARGSRHATRRRYDDHGSARDVTSDMMSGSIGSRVAFRSSISRRSGQLHVRQGRQWPAEVRIYVDSRRCTRSALEKRQNARTISARDAASIRFRHEKALRRLRQTVHCLRISPSRGRVALEHPLGRSRTV